MALSEKTPDIFNRALKNNGFKLLITNPVIKSYRHYDLITDNTNDLKEIMFVIQ